MDKFSTAAGYHWNDRNTKALMQGEIIVETRSHSDWGGAVSATMYLPMQRSHVWQQVTDYPRWVQYFPDVTISEVLHRGEVKRLYQAALTIQEIAE